MRENEISKVVVDKAFRIHKELGPGLFESVYERILVHELRKNFSLINNQLPLPVIWEDVKLDHGFRIDVLIENKVLVEIKSVETLNPVHFKQVLTYLKLSEVKLGLLINFNEALIKNGIHRIVNRL